MNVAVSVGITVSSCDITESAYEECGILDYNYFHYCSDSVDVKNGGVLPPLPDTSSWHIA
jgi:hypothetical protein